MESTLPRPVKELKGFSKVELEPGEKKTVEILIDKTALQYYDPEKNDWVYEPGEFKVLIGASSRDIKIKAEFTGE